LTQSARGADYGANGNAYYKYSDKLSPVTDEKPYLNNARSSDMGTDE
jgi:hypothetical protein